jgi:TolB-like protein/DNA-binding winged helix-turn-helix (wHTH) protein/Tfp pilus assembly protein PilF
MELKERHLYEFGPFRLEPAEHLLLRNGQAIPLAPKVFDTLLVLVQNSGHLVDKDELLRRVWPDTFVEEGNLTKNIFALRKILEGGRKGEKLIETIPKLGYRFVAPVKELREPALVGLKEDLASRVVTSSVEAARDQGASRRSRLASWRAAVLAGLSLALILAVLVYMFLFRGLRDKYQPQIDSLAVLPLANLSGDPTQDYFADGMTEALIAGLAKVRALRVTSRTSVMQYKGTRKPLLDVAHELDVDAIVEGTVQRFGQQVKITTRLIQMPTERLLWTETYERDLGDILALQSEIARAVIQEVQINVTPQEQMRLAKARPVKPQAYDDYLRGRFYAIRQNKADNETAIVMLERSVATDPSFASAQAELAQVYVWRFFLFTPGEKDWEEKAFVAVEKALSLDPDLAEAYLARGRLLWTPANHFPHEKAIQEYGRALALNPNLDEAQNQLALVYNHIGAFDRALQELQKAVAINPSNTLAQFRIGQTFLFQGKHEQALTALQQIARAVNPALVGHNTAMALLRLGRRDEAAALLVELLRDYPQDEGGVFSSVQALLAASTGEKTKAEREIRKAIEKGKGFGHFHHTAYNIACAYALMKKTEPAFNWLQAAADDGFPCYPMFEDDAYLDHLRQDPRFIALIAKLKEQREHYRTRL